MGKMGNFGNWENSTGGVGCEAGGSASEKMHQHSYGAIL